MMMGDSDEWGDEELAAELDALEAAAAEEELGAMMAAASMPPMTIEIRQPQASCA